MEKKDPPGKIDSAMIVGCLSLKLLKEDSMVLQTAYAFGKKFDASFREVEQMVRAELAKEGFGIMTEINVQDKFKEKLGREFREYVILGACNPALAWEAFAKEINIGTLLPCNVVVYRDDDGKTVVMVMDPVAALGVIGNAELTEIAAQVRCRMERVLAAL
jgi:uncharacterized protein (DUF302 family)